MSRFTIIVAATQSNGIGQKGRLPWRLPKEMAYFARMTSSAPEGSQNAVIMGRNTWESIPNKFRPLAKRVNLVLSKNKDYSPDPGALVCPDLQSALDCLGSTTYRNFIIGGACLYSEALASPLLDRVLVTRIISPDFDQCDTFMPQLGEAWKRCTHDELSEWAGFAVPNGLQEERGVQYEFQMWIRSR